MQLKSSIVVLALGLLAGTGAKAEIIASSKTDIDNAHTAYFMLSDQLSAKTSERCPDIRGARNLVINVVSRFSGRSTAQYSGCYYFVSQDTVKLIFWDHDPRDRKSVEKSLSSFQKATQFKGWGFED
ncbi:hypothetical protein [Microvirga lotononidis]|nr:hypothetical protein [Microvirga lotononidis]WQO31603.1 hypothetical protein U0023_29975 [Microvirga lotononidis]